MARPLSRHAALLLIPLLLSVPARHAYADYFEGYAVFDPTGPGFDKAMCTISIVYPVIVDDVAGNPGVFTMAGLDNQSTVCFVSAQTGWWAHSEVDDTLGVSTVVETYMEYTDETGQQALLPTGETPASNAYYGVMRNGDDMEFHIGADIYVLDWNVFDREPFCSAQFTAILNTSAYDRTPGHVSDHCQFGVCRVRFPGQADFLAPFSTAGQAGSNVFKLDDVSYGEVLYVSDGFFATWDTRSP